MKTIYFITSNNHKLREARQILKGFRIVNKKLDLLELQGEPERIIWDKARIAYKKLRKPLFVEDTCLCLDALKGLPGPYVSSFLKKIGNKGLVKLLSAHKNRKAVAKSLIGFAESAKDIKVFVGATEGKIVNARGVGCFGLFGFDPIFQPKGHSKTYAQMTHEEKNKISHRRKALEKFRRHLSTKK